MAFDVGILLTGITRVFFNRKYWKRVVLGEFETTSEEWGQISDFLDTKLVQKLSDFDKLSYQDRLRLEIELKQVPILKQLSLDEVAFLYTNEVELDTYFDVVIAKGDFIRGFREIEWVENGYVLKERNKKHDLAFVSFFSVVVFGLSVAVGMFVAYSIPWVTSVINTSWIIGFIVISIMAMWIPFASMPSNFKLALERLKKNKKYTQIFKDASAN